SKLGNQIASASVELGDAIVSIHRSEMLNFFQILKLDTQLDFSMLLDVTAVDWLDNRDARFEVVYHLMSLSKKFRLRVKIQLEEQAPEVDSLVPLWPSANFMEREVWDMFGIEFAGHPDLRRILMYDEFEGHPLRKDYPLRGKQPRVPLRHPEVENTSRLMHRDPLVHIGGAAK
ncbi:MAG: NADH-quinone oxidoreductase subunit C, partial [Bdellovibrionales bacterium]|nr:NADH-quinone oxidoreductase subunit C [Bdellovibrionales bacterium]